MLPSVNLRDHFLEINLESLNREGTKELHTRQIHLDLLRFNQESYFEFNLGSARLDICVMMENSEVKIPSELMLNDFLEDIQQRVKIFPDDLADHLKIASKVPYSVDLSYNQIPHDQDKKQSLLATILYHMFPSASNDRQQSVWLNNYIKELNQADLLKQSSPALPRPSKPLRRTCTLGSLQSFQTRRSD